MSTFAVKIKRILGIEPHPNADAIEFAVIDGYRSIVKKNEFKSGDLVAYIPEASVLPEWLLKSMRFWNFEKNQGTLNGKGFNRVKAVELRGSLSQGICYPVHTATLGSDNDCLESVSRISANKGAGGIHQLQVVEGDDVTGFLEITKYEPEIPLEMIGELFSAGIDFALNFDIENWKSYPNIIERGEEVVFTEKLHGVCTIVAVLPYRHAHPEAFGERKNILIYCKSLGAKGLAFKNNEKNQSNIYIRGTKNLIERIDELQRLDPDGPLKPEFTIGEVFGPGIQDLAYGKTLDFRIFAAVSGYSGEHTYQNWPFIEEMLAPRLCAKTVPLLYRGPFSEEVMRQYTDGKTTLDANHIREGIVMTPVSERRAPRIGRVSLKSVSANYLTRKGGTEYS